MRLLNRQEEKERQSRLTLLQNPALGGNISPPGLWTLVILLGCENDDWFVHSLCEMRGLSRYAKRTNRLTGWEQRELSA
ncbi:hypothetical protein SRHO_G00328160 [Serrasalmus rhombeus]